MPRVFLAVAALAACLSACTAPAGVSATPEASAVPTPGASATPTPAPTPAEPRADVPLQGKFLFYEDFEKSLDKWSLSGGGDGIAWLRLNAFTCGGAWTMLLGTPEWTTFSRARGEAWLTLKEPLDLKTANRPHLVYDVRGETIPQDAVVIQPEASTDGAAWKPVGEAAYGRYRFVSTHFADLTPYQGGAVRLRFKATFAVGEAAIKGMLLDDVRVLEPDLTRGS